MATIQAFVVERQIKFLFHFTRLENLTSILARGLYPRGECAERGITAITNDGYRLDYTDAICLSVGFPNYKMFYGLRKDSPGTQWAVVALRPDVLWLKDCAFCRENAAKAAVTDIPVAHRKGLAAFRTLFDDFEDKQRASLNLPPEYPTHPQAEVLVFEHIGPESIIGAVFNDIAFRDQYLAKGTAYQFKYIPDLFKGRVDYMHWRRSG